MGWIKNLKKIVFTALMALVTLLSVLLKSIMLVFSSALYALLLVLIKNQNWKIISSKF